MTMKKRPSIVTGAGMMRGNPTRTEMGSSREGQKEIEVRIPDTDTEMKLLDETDTKMWMKVEIDTGGKRERRPMISLIGIREEMVVKQLSIATEEGKKKGRLALTEMDKREGQMETKVRIPNTGIEMKTLEETGTKM
jgi:hypothetical protein